jgi:D-3-phosphoglycerate dehydrogenase
MPTVEVAFLDSLHPAVAALIRSSLPRDWSARFAKSRAFPDQAAALARAEVAFVLGAPVGAELIARAPRLRLVQKLGAGVDKIDREACAGRGIAVARLAAGNAVPVAEHTVMLMLAALRRLPLVDRRTREGAWLKEEARGMHRQLHGKRVGLVGFGAIGRRVAAVLAGFGVEIVYYDPRPAPPEVERRLEARRLPLDEVVETSDILSLHLPLLPETARIIDAQRIARMKPGAVLVNCARGGLVDEGALARALDEGRLMAAALDTFETEPPVGSPLLRLERTVVTSHLAGATLDNFAAVLARAIDNARRYLDGLGLPEEDVVFLPEPAVRKLAKGSGG